MKNSTHVCIKCGELCHPFCAKRGIGFNEIEGKNYATVCPQCGDKEGKEIANGDKEGAFLVFPY